MPVPLEGHLARSRYLPILSLVAVNAAALAGARTDYHGDWGADDLDYLSRYDGLSDVGSSRT